MLGTTDLYSQITQIMGLNFVSVESVSINQWFSLPI